MIISIQKLQEKSTQGIIPRIGFKSLSVSLLAAKAMNTLLAFVLVGSFSTSSILAQDHTLLIHKDGAPMATGSNSHGQLGGGEVVQANHPIPSKFGISAVSSGEYHTVYLKSDGTVWATGSNSSGQLGDGTTTSRSNPVEVKNIDGTRLSGVVAISAGFSHTVYLKSDGSVWATGSNSNGRLGDGTTTNRSNPVEVKNSDGTGLSGVIAISAGSSHTVYLKSDGSVWATGSNSNGQLGDGTTTNRSNPVEVKNSDGTGLSDVVGISAGNYHTVYLKSDGTVWGTGLNSTGSLGDGTTTNRSNPVEVKNSDGTGLSGVVTISAGSSHTVYLKSDGSVWATGWNGSGRLGDGTNTRRLNPVEVKYSDGTGLSGVVGISAGNSHTVYVKNDGTVWATGSNSNGQLGDGTTTSRNNPVQVKNSDGTGLSGVIDISAGSSHTVYLNSDGSVWATGVNFDGRLGDGTNTQRLNPVETLQETSGKLSNIIATTSGARHTVYLKSDGTVWATGINDSGELGDGTTTSRSNPVQVTNSDGTGFTGVVEISGGFHHTVFLKSDGTVWATGSNSTGSLGDGTTTNRSNPVQVKNSDGTSLTGVVRISAGKRHSVFLKSDGTVWATGINDSGLLGDGTTTNRSNPVQVTNSDGTGLSGVVAISAGSYHTVYLKSDGTVWATGKNNVGQLGDSTNIDRSNPVEVKNSDGSGLTGVVEISAGDGHTVYVKNDGAVWATGSNSNGKLGDGTTTNRSNPVQVKNSDGTGLSGVIDISAGSSHTVYLKSDGSVWATGGNGYGQLGDGTTTNRSNPVVVKNSDDTGLSGVVGISGGSDHTVYLKSDGSVWATGYNNRGQLGDGTTTDRSNPMQVASTWPEPFGKVYLKTISAGYVHTVYLKSDGSVWATGDNAYGQLGDGTNTDRSNPVEVKNSDGTGFRGVIAISAGNHHTVFLKNDGTVWATGRNYWGQIWRRHENKP